MNHRKKVLINKFNNQNKNVSLKLDIVEQINEKKIAFANNTDIPHTSGDVLEAFINICEGRKIKVACISNVFNPNIDWDKSEVAVKTFFQLMMDTFDTVYIVAGGVNNARGYAEYKDLDLQVFQGMCLLDQYKQMMKSIFASRRIKILAQYNVNIGNDWILCVNPKGKRLVSGHTASGILPQVYKNVLVAYRDHMAYIPDKGGRYIGIEIGSMSKISFDLSKPADPGKYLGNNGFVILEDYKHTMFDRNNMGIKNK